MIDLDRIEGFDWDLKLKSDWGNSRKSVDKHGVSMAEAEQVFFNEPLLVAADAGHSASEARFHALGQADNGRRLHVTFTVRRNGTLLRVISARDMHRKERTRYAEDA